MVGAVVWCVHTFAWAGCWGWGGSKGYIVGVVQDGVGGWVGLLSSANRRAAERLVQARWLVRRIMRASRAAPMPATPARHITAPLHPRKHAPACTRRQAQPNSATRTTPVPPSTCPSSRAHSRTPPWHPSPPPPPHITPQTQLPLPSCPSAAAHPPSSSPLAMSYSSTSSAPSAGLHGPGRAAQPLGGQRNAAG